MSRECGVCGSVIEGVMSPKDLRRFFSYVEQTPTCWTWHGYVTRHGYGRWGLGGRAELVHRSAYEHFVGPVPDGLVVDHICNTRACVNPSHLAAVTRAANTLRGIGISAQNARKTHCKRGHPLIPSNLLVSPLRDGRRSCRACARRGAKQRKEAAVGNHIRRRQGTD